MSEFPAPFTKKPFARRLAGLKNERQSFEPHWKALSKNIEPRRSRFLLNDRNKGERVNTSIIDNTATLAARTMSSGMMAGITSPARPWFRLKLQDPDLAEFGPVRNWLNIVQRTMRDMYSRSNLYNVLPGVYRDLGVFATAAISLLEDIQTATRFYSYTIGEYWISLDATLRVDAFYREVDMTVGQIVSAYGLDRVSDSIKTAYRTGHVDAWRSVVHLIERNDDRVVDVADYRGMPWRSVHYESDSADNAEVLRVRGFREFPLMIPRWEVTGTDVYGTSCPGMDVLGDVKALQNEQLRKGQGIEKMVNPPMTGPSSLRNKPSSTLPGSVTYLDSTTQGKFEPAYKVDVPLRDLKEDILEVKQRISRGFFEDLFLMLAQSDRREITAREVEERHEEKLLMLGPVLERIHDELLSPMIDRTFNMGMRLGLFPEPPQEIQGQQLRVEFISLLAQAQHAVGIGAIERTLGFVGNLAGVNEQVLDKVDFDQAVDEHASMTGMPPQIIRSDDQVAELRRQRARQQQADAVALRSQQAAETAKLLAEVPTNEGNLLQQVTGGQVG